MRFLRALCAQRSGQRFVLESEHYAYTESLFQFRSGRTPDPTAHHRFSRVPFPNPPVGTSRKHSVVTLGIDGEPSNTEIGFMELLAGDKVFGN